MKLGKLISIIVFVFLVNIAWSQAIPQNRNNKGKVEKKEKRDDKKKEQKKIKKVPPAKKKLMQKRNQAQKKKLRTANRRVRNMQKKGRR